MKIRDHKDLDVYRLAFDAAMQIFEITKSFPTEEKYSLTDQIRRSSRSVAANIAEAFRKRRYPKAFVAKLSDSEANILASGSLYAYDRAKLPGPVQTSTTQISV